MNAMITKKEVPLNFNRVARWYDALQKMNPGYTEHLRLSAERLAVKPDANLLDLCCGTGLSTEALRAVYPQARIDALDASEGMLEVARNRGLAQPLSYILADVMELTPEQLNGPYDGILMAYGIRNMPDADAALARLFPLLKKGGTICFHEYSVSDSKWSRLMWNVVASTVIIPLGQLTSPGAPIYRYLRRSVLEFDGVTRFEQRLRDAGFVDVHTEPTNGWAKGIVHSFLARKPG
ncbi:MAG: class I SAM-dependent methyltransferase [Spirochaetaceae bacterium]|nr:MAG: class I SAM-dependent methyltransferase [Spirochaetaceae bacterium]